MPTTTLASVLEQYIEVYGRLLELARRKQMTLVNVDAPALDPIIAAEEQLLQQLSDLDAQRAVATAPLAGGEHAEVTLAQLLPGLPAPDREALTRLRDRLVNVLEELRRVGSENNALLHQALQVVQGTIRLFGQFPAASVYSASGALVDGRRPVVDRRA